MKFRKKPVIIEAITFDELVAHGIASGAPLYDGVPWSFDYAGHPITHENDDCYLIPATEGFGKMGRDDMLVADAEGDLYPIKLDIFVAMYEAAGLPPQEKCSYCGEYYAVPVSHHHDEAECDANRAMKEPR